MSDGTVIDSEPMLDLVPDFQLDQATTTLFGGSRLWRYDFPFVETDRKLIAVEYADFGDAILNNQPPEVSGEMGTRSVAVSYTMLESGQLHQAVRVDDLIAEKVNSYQFEINESMGI
jgi:hypothetical protein